MLLYRISNNLRLGDAAISETKRLKLSLEILLFEILSLSNFDELLIN
jgi:hypothetical protein